MSGSAAGKFQDHYVMLGVEPRADADTIQAAYAKVTQKYHPNNPETGDKAKFDSVNLAYEVLSTPDLRAEFDKLKGVDQDVGNPTFSGPLFFDALRHGTALRSAILCVLYDRRRTKTFKPSLSLRHLEGMLQASSEELNFALWYLKQRGLAANDDKSSLNITVEGMDYIENNPPSADRIIPLIKPESLASNDPKALQKKPAEKEKPAETPKVEEPVLNVLNRALTRSDQASQNDRLLPLLRR